ncbi:hypothetical protein [Hyphococcus sp.]|uniref:hypothetical protein n=1 Tax=Hyphococcus sp. TaxID=2038636 RepID=UPI0035C78584
MLRSLAAVIVAVIVGLAAAKTVEGGGAALLGAAPGAAVYGALLLAGWLAGAFVAAALALIIGRRWAPLGALGAAAIFLAAVITLFSYPLSWLLWPGAIITTMLGGFAAIRLTGARKEHPDMRRKDGLFDE